MNEEKIQIEDRQRLFAQRYGYAPLPDVLNHELCKEFRYAVYSAVMDEIWQAEKSLSQPENHPNGAFLIKIITTTQTQIMENYDPWHSEGNKCSFREAVELISGLLKNGHFAQVLSICELILREADPNEAIYNNLEAVFSRCLAPYALDDSADPICIVPLSTPENGEAIVEDMDSIQQSNLAAAHQYLRNAARHINAERHGDAIAASVHAVEAIACEITGEKVLIRAALNTLEKDGLLDHTALKEGISKLYGYASDTVRHGQTQLVKQTRDEALLIFSSCAAIAGYLARKKMQKERVE